MDARAIVEMMPFMNSHAHTLEEAEIAAAHLTVSIWARMLLGRKFDLYTALVLGESEMLPHSNHSAKPTSTTRRHFQSMTGNCRLEGMMR